MISNCDCSRWVKVDVREPHMSDGSAVSGETDAGR